ncbi:MAG TPA: nitroreductase family protein [Desulfitobacteriaceae bacterium]|nr:nitroreductase family protein [Desulfitobacteriaceae bacterium]
MSIITIEQELCRKCGLCSAVCVDDVFAKANPGEFPQVAKEKNCFSCGHCVSVCPNNAIKHKRLRNENIRPIGSKTLEPEVMENFLRSKRSARHFKKTEVEKGIIIRLLHIAQQAPSDANSQDRRYIVVTDPQKIEELEKNVVKYYKSLLFWMKYPVRKFLDLFTPNLIRELEKILPDFTGMVKKYQLGERPVFRNAPCIIFICANKGNVMGKDNCIIAQDYLMLQAETMGLGSCVIGNATGAPGSIAKSLKIAKEQQVYAAIILGYPEYFFVRGVDRQDPEVKWL